MRRFLCLWFPRFPTDRWRRLRPDAASGPLALTLPGQGGIRLTATDPAASALGLAAGMRLADARALVPELTAVDAEPEADIVSLAALADWCHRYSPLCAVDGPVCAVDKVDGIRIDITGCAHLHGGEASLVADILRRLDGFGLAASAAIAGTPAAGWGWARYRPQGAGPILEAGDMNPLLDLPVAALRLEAETLDSLRTLGLDRIGAVARLPRGALGQRLGLAVLDRLDRLFGRLAEPISPRALAEPWLARRIFAEPIGRREDIDAATLALAERLCRDLSLAGRGARRLELGFFRVDGTVQRLGIGTSRPSHGARHLMRLFVERLDQVDPGFGIEAMVLEAVETGPLTPAQTSFTGKKGIEEADLAGLVDRLRNRLGPDRVVQLFPRESHVPERAEIKRIASLEGYRSHTSFFSSKLCVMRGLDPRTHAYPPAQMSEDRASRRRVGTRVKPAHDDLGKELEMCECRSPQAGTGPERHYEPKRSSWTPPQKAARPLKLLPIPEPITAMALIPDDPPLSFRWRDRVHTIVAADGPERIGPEWWLGAAPRKPRDYYRVEDQAGRRFWLYREGLYDGKETPRWFLHGFFA